MSHGLSRTPIYSVWENMKATCKKCDLYLEHEWKNFIPFYEWAIEHGYQEGLYLNRIDKSQGYVKSNLEFVTKKVRIKHGKYNTRLYGIWLGIKERCHNPRDTAYQFYGEKGISVCNGWRNSFQYFYEWSTTNGYKDSLTIDRVNPEGNYEPSNCRWVDFEIQANNKITSQLMEINGETKTLTQWAREFGISPVTVFSRYNKGIRGIELFEVPKKTGSGSPFNITIDGETKRLSEWSRISGLHHQTIRDRYDNGIRGKELLTERIPRNFEYLVEIDGITKPLKHWECVSNVSYDTLLERYHKGMRGNDLLKEREKLTIKIEIEGVIKTIDEWSKETGINKSTISSRYQSGKQGNDLIRPIRVKIIVEYRGKSQSLNAWGNELGIDPETLRRRYHKGLRGEELFSKKN